jgi:hypothetical protein
LLATRDMAGSKGAFQKPLKLQGARSIKHAGS